MKKAFSLTIAVLFVILSLNIISADNGVVWTTRNDCGTEQQDVNQYSVGEKVFINGRNFDSGDYDWTITKQSGPDKNESASGNKTVDSSGSFCFEAYTIQPNDTGEYSVDFGKKNDNYHIRNIPVVQEFGFIIGGLTLVSPACIFFFVRRK